MNFCYSTKIKKFKWKYKNKVIIILNRGKGNIYDVKLDFSETIDISQSILQKDKAQIIYTLYGVIIPIDKVVLMLILLHHIKIQLIINDIDLMMLLLILLITSKKKLLNFESLYIVL